LTLAWSADLGLSRQSSNTEMPTNWSPCWQKGEVEPIWLAWLGVVWRCPKKDG
jgi:hypothetical protein